MEPIHFEISTELEELHSIVIRNQEQTEESEKEFVCCDFMNLPTGFIPR